MIDIKSVVTKTRVIIISIIILVGLGIGLYKGTISITENSVIDKIITSLENIQTNSTELVEMYEEVE